MLSNQKIIFGTHNANKVKEINSLLPAGFELLSLRDLEYHNEIEETGTTLEENAILKAQKIYDEFQMPVFAEDTGLEIVALGGRPGVYSARYAGLNRSSEHNMNLVLEQLKKISKRQAQFRTVIAYIDERGIYLFEGKVSGTILHEKTGKEGFGYDPIFCPDGEVRSFAQMTEIEKNQISHRARAMAKLVEWLKGN